MHQKEEHGLEIKAMMFVTLTLQHITSHSAVTDTLDKVYTCSIHNVTTNEELDAKGVYSKSQFGQIQISLKFVLLWNAEWLTYQKYTIGLHTDYFAIWRLEFTE